MLINLTEIEGPSATLAGSGVPSPPQEQQESNPSAGLLDLLSGDFSPLPPAAVPGQLRTRTDVVVSHSAPAPSDDGAARTQRPTLQELEQRLLDGKS